MTLTWSAPLWVRDECEPAERSTKALKNYDAPRGGGSTAPACGETQSNVSAIGGPEAQNRGIDRNHPLESNR
jgi:hypothetical protein